MEILNFDPFPFCGSGGSDCNFRSASPELLAVRQWAEAAAIPNRFYCSTGSLQLLPSGLFLAALPIQKTSL